MSKVDPQIVEAIQSDICRRTREGMTLTQAKAEVTESWKGLETPATIRKALATITERKV